MNNLGPIIDSMPLHRPRNTQFQELAQILYNLYHEKDKKVHITGESARGTYISGTESINPVILMYTNEDMSPSYPYAAFLPNKYKADLEGRISEKYGANAVLQRQNGVYNVRNPVSGETHISFVVQKYDEKTVQYDQKFNERLNYLTAKLKNPEQGKAYILGQIKGLKELFSKVGLYSANHALSDPLNGIEAEQMLIQLGYIQPESYGQLKGGYSVGTIMQKLLDQKDNFQIINPVNGQDLAENLRKNVHGWNKLMEFAKICAKYDLATSGNRVGDPEKGKYSDTKQGFSADSGLTHYDLQYQDARTEGPNLVSSLNTSTGNDVGKPVLNSTAYSKEKQNPSYNPGFRYKNPILRGGGYNPQ